MIHRESTTGIVIGGGVIGLCTAWELARRGVRVILVERDLLGKATSWAACGILPPANLETATDPIDQLRGLSHRLFPQWHDELLSLTGIDSGYRRCGGWYLADTPGERAAMIGMTDYWSDRRIACEPVSLEALAEREPALRQRSLCEPLPSAWWVPDECQIRSPRYLKALIAACRLAGVELIENSPVVDVQTRMLSVEVQLESQVLAGDFAVLCGGAWTGQLASRFHLQQSIIPIRGQMILLRTPTQPLRGIVNIGNRYLVPREDGLTLVGSNEEEVGFVLGTTPQVLQSLHQFAVRLCPELQHAELVQSWSGLRPMTFDGFPMIGALPLVDNVFVAAGHYRSGIHLSCSTAVEIANRILGVDNIVDLEPFRVGKQQHIQLTFQGST